MNGLQAEKFNTFYLAVRAYSLPVSVMSWLIPFVYAAFNSGNILYGILALPGIILLHLASNLFDDIVDYYRELIAIRKGKKTNFNFQKGKCSYIFDNKLTLKQACLLDLILFFLAFLIAIFFFCISGTKLLYIIIPSIVLCLSYPVLGCLGFGEIIIALIFSPLLYSGVYFVMTSHFSYEILLLSVSTGLLSVAVLFNHSLLDYKYDTTNRKITLCRLCRSEKNALIVLFFLVLCAYINLIVCICIGKLSLFYLLPFLSLPFALKLISEMKIYINRDKTPDNAKCFLQKFMLAQNLQKYFIILLCISIILSNLVKF